MQANRIKLKRSDGGNIYIDRIKKIYADGTRLIVEHYDASGELRVNFWRFPIQVKGFVTYG